MVAAHIDEIGFVVSHIDDKGLLRLVPLGRPGVKPAYLRSGRSTRSGNAESRCRLTGPLTR